MIISSNTKQSFASTTGIKVTQNSSSSTNQSKNTEATM